ncbi:hypothetical protein CP03DC29_0778A, partial [Chlamydia psittaci 03DC29]
MAPPS